MNKEFTRTPKSLVSGFATLEIMIALSILTLTLSAVALVSFGNQSLMADMSTGREALDLAEKMLETESALGISDFSLVHPIATFTSGIYQQKLDVTSMDFFRKKVSATVSWQVAFGRSQHITLSKIITDPENVTGGDTCNSFVESDWTHPTVKNSVTNFAELVSDNTASYSISDIDAHENRLYVSVDKTSVSSKENFFIFDITHPENPILLGRVDNSPTNAAGLTAIAIASSSTGSYAFAANGISSNFATCTPGRNCAQLQIIDVSDPASPIVVTSFLIPTSTAPFVTGSGGKAVGQSIFYKNGYMYLGLTKTQSGPEFNVIDVHDPLNPVWVGGLSFGTTIHAIYVRGNYAYVAHKADNFPLPQEQLTVIDISNPHNLHRTSGYWNTGGILNAGKSLSMVGNTIYLGRLASKISGGNDTIPEFYALDATDGTAIPSTALGTIALATPESLNGIVVRDSLAFFITTSQFQIWNIADLSHITSVTSLPIPNKGATTPTVDCEKNYFFIGSNDVNDKGFISIITDTP